MAYQPTVTLNANAVTHDAFGRQRISDLATLFDSQVQYDTQTLLWEYALTGTGAAAHLPNESSVRLRVAASGDKVIRQTRQYIRYQPGKSNLVAITFNMGATNANVRQRIGYFDAANGIFLERAGTTVKLVRRTFTGGSASDADAVAQASWNIDTFNGTGPSGLTLDLTKVQILLIDLQWLGVGRVRVGFDINGVFYPAHQFVHANILTSVYMTTANLPIRYEIEATGAPGGNVDLISICSSAASEGGFDIAGGYPRAVGNGATGITVTSRQAILSIRPKATFNSIVNRGQIVLEGWDVAAETNGCYYEIVYNGTLGGTPSWTSAGTNSIVEYDVAGTTVTGGDVIASGYVMASNQVKSAVNEALVTRLPLTLDIAGANPINVSIVCTSFTGNSIDRGAFQWREIF